MSGSLIASELGEKLQAYRKQQFTGLVKVTSPNQQQWYIYYILGRIVWTKSRTHSLRRWQRHLSIHSPVFFEKLEKPVAHAYESWNYGALARLVKLKQFRRDRFSKMVVGCVREDIFDLLYVGTLQHRKTGQLLTYETAKKQAAIVPFVMIQQELAWQTAQQDWQAWENAGLTKVSPDLAPVIAQVETLKAHTPEKTFQILTRFVDGQNTLRDLAIIFKQPIIPLTKSLLPYISRRMLNLVEVPDIVENANDGFHPDLLPPQSTDREINPIAPGPVSLDEVALPVLPGKNDQNGMAHNGVQDSTQKVVVGRKIAQASAAIPQPGFNQSAIKATRKVSRNAAQIVYIDDSPADSRTMGRIVEELGYQYNNIQDPLQALPTLLEIKPELIFLDLVMPFANGYEVCAQIRRISAFEETPIVIVTSNDGIADRVRAKVVGASGFLGKPIQSKKVSKVLKKYLDSSEDSDFPATQNTPVMF